MRHLKAHRKLGRTTEHRMSMLRNMATSLINSEKEHIVTTVQKAKELRPFVEKAITLARKAHGLEGEDGTLRGVHLRRQAARFFHAGNSTFKIASSRFRGKKGEPKDVIERTAGVAAVQRLFNELGAAYKDRNGGYTRIIKLGRRQGDNAEMAVIELVDNPSEMAAAADKASFEEADIMGDNTASAKAKDKVAEKKDKQASDPSFNMDELQALAALVNEHGFTDFEFENENIRVRLSKMTGTPVVHQAAPVHHAPAAAPAAESTSPGPAAEADSGLHKIVSPIVGTFYRSPGPDKDSYVSEGSSVSPETTVCIVEAMKLMNEIQAEVSGTIEKIYVENGQPVEYGQPLFGVRK